MKEADFTRRLFHPTPGKLFAVLLVVEGILFLANWFHWTPKGYAVLIAVALVALTMVVLLLSFTGALLFRWQFQFSLRSLLVLTVAVAVPCSWLTEEMRQVKKQRAVLEPLSKRGEVQYTFGASKWSPPPAWLRNIFGDAFFGDVVWIALSSKITNDDLINLEGLKLTPCLYLHSSQLTDAGLAHLKGLNRLKLLDLTNSNRITDAGLKHLGELKQLEILDLRGTAITDAGLKHLAKLKQLQGLGLGQTQIQGSGLEHLQGLETLWGLMIDGSPITDDTLPSVGKLKQLSFLDVSGTPISDAGLKHLKGMTRLNLLRIKKTKITDEGVEKLRQALPNCSIEHTNTNTSFKGSNP